MALQEGFRMKQKGSRRTRKGHLQEGEREPVRMPGGSGRSGRFGKKHSHQDDVSRMRGLRTTRPSGDRKSCHGRAGSTNCSWNAAKRTGSTVYTVLPFFVSASRNAMLRAVQFFS
ncbi:hypothetical protein FCH31_12020 [Lelliottia amnigena]|nr:hypothetical protein CO697_12040 [Lelliottia amnigena]NTX70152.1 hypothetical protein [Lelliottia amnigena]PEG65928.1 hypothetical protein CRH15_05895 [Lelliottia amnigena]TCD25705.1 hypothetical protein E0D81_00295 [Lelliottia amnigena]